MRTLRRALPAGAQQSAARRLQRRILALPEFRKAKRIGLYWPADGEISPLPILCACRGRKIIFLPKIIRGGKLRFRLYRGRRGLKKNGFGIPEPAQGPDIHPKALDIVLLPLVAFDRQGNRLGMGSGYYDKSFAFLRQRHRPAKPLLIGLAHSFQECGQLPADPWDIPLAAIVTPSQLFRFSRRPH